MPFLITFKSNEQNFHILLYLFQSNRIGKFHTCIRNCCDLFENYHNKCDWFLFLEMLLSPRLSRANWLQNSNVADVLNGAYCRPYHPTHSLCSIRTAKCLRIEEHTTQHFEHEAWFLKLATASASSTFSERGGILSWKLDVCSFDVYRLYTMCLCNAFNMSITVFLANEAIQVMMRDVK